MIVEGAPSTPQDVLREIFGGGSMKHFNVKTWLLMSLVPGIFAAFVVMPVLLLNFQAPAPLGILGGILAALAVGFAMEMSIISKIKKEEAAIAEQKKAQTAQERKDFSKDCRNFQIFSAHDLESPEKKQRFQLIAKKHHLDDLNTEELLAILKEGEADYAAEQQQMQEGQRQALRKKLEEEKSKLAALLEFAQYHGVDKTQAMLGRELADLRTSINNTMFTPPAMIPKQKESDGMFAAGTAYGIGGVIPAAASLARTEQKNAQIRQANAQIDQINSALVGAAAMANADRYGIQQRMEPFKERASTLLIDEDSAAVFPHLTFSDPKVQVSNTGTVTVTVKVKEDHNIKVFGKPAIADGSIIAEIYDKDGQKVGEATMVFPVFGTGNLYFRQKVYHWRENDETVELTGMCLACADPHEKYTVKFVPGDLWAMEK